MNLAESRASCILEPPPVSTKRAKALSFEQFWEAVLVGVVRALMRYPVIRKAKKGDLARVRKQTSDALHAALRLAVTPTDAAHATLGLDRIRDAMPVAGDVLDDVAIAFGAGHRARATRAMLELKDVVLGDSLFVQACRALAAEHEAAGTAYVRPVRAMCIVDRESRTVALTCAGGEIRIYRIRRNEATVMQGAAFLGMVRAILARRVAKETSS